MNKKGNFFVIGVVIIFFLGFLSVIVGIVIQADQFDTILGEDIHQIRFLETKIQKHQAFFELSAREIFVGVLDSNVYASFFEYLVMQNILQEQEGYIVEDFTIFETNFDLWLESEFNTAWKTYVAKYSEHMGRLLKENKLDIFESMPAGYYSQDEVLLYRQGNSISGFSTTPVSISSSGAKMVYYPVFTVDKTSAETYLSQLRVVPTEYTNVLSCIGYPTSFREIKDCASQHTFILYEKEKVLVTQFFDVVLKIPLVHPAVDALYESLPEDYEYSDTDLDAIPILYVP